MQNQRKPSYDEVFQRNYGVFSDTEQERIRKARVMIIGCGGIGGIVAIELCRSGFEHFFLVEPDVYSLTNINRQICCNRDTLGRNKAEVLREDMLRINDGCDVEVAKGIIPVEHLADNLSGKDALVSSADDFAYSIVASRIAKKLRVPSVIGLPVGSLVRVWSNTESSPPIEDYFALPKNEPDYETLYNALYNPEEKRAYARWAQKHCDWNTRWAEGYAKGEFSLSQIAPVVWLASSLASLEVLKIVTKKWKPIVFPRYWKITPVEASIGEFRIHP